MAKLLQKKSSFTYVLLFAAIEGALVMSFELLSGQILNLVFGASLHAWAVVLSITMFSLSIGYFSSIWIMNNTNVWIEKCLFYIYTLLAFYPFIADLVLKFIESDSLYFRLVTVATLLLFPPLVLLGTILPALIQRCTKLSAEANPGYIFGVSTIAGIITAFSLGFWTIPTFGIRNTAWGLSMLLVFFLLFYTWSKLPKIWTISILIICFSSSVVQFQKQDKNSNIKRIYESHGLLGHVLVADNQYVSESGRKNWARTLYVNSMPQTIVDVETGLPLFSSYITEIAATIDHLPSSSKVLLIGIGGGNLLPLLSKKGFDIDVCELDPRITMAATKYFPETSRLHGISYYNDDGRHFLRSTQDTYDLIIFDIFAGELPPSHMFTLECFNETKRALNTDGIFLLNFLGKASGPRSKVVQKLAKTLETAYGDFKIKQVQGVDNVLLMSSLKTSTLHNLETTWQGPSEYLFLSNEVYSDDRSDLDILFAPTARFNRTWYNEVFINRLLDSDDQIFK